MSPNTAIEDAGALTTFYCPRSSFGLSVHVFNDRQIIFGVNARFPFRP